MKNLIFSALSFSILVIMACNDSNGTSGDKKETAAKESINTKVDSTENIITFKVNKQLIVSFGWNISRYDYGAGIGTCLNVTSDMNQQPKTININVNGDKPGKYRLESGLKTSRTHGVAYGSYYSDYILNMAHPYSFVSGEFTITSIDTAAGSLNATFYGTAKTAKGDSVIITDGNVIHGKLKGGVMKLN